MKKLFIIALTTLGFTFAAQAQDDDIVGQTAQGKWLIEANTNTSGDIEALISGIKGPGNTGFSFTTVDGETIWNIGIEGGYFVVDDLAVKVGLGYGDYFSDGIFSYKVGAKYYINSQIPVGVDLNGVSVNNYNSMYIGAQAGYAWFLGKNVSVEPALRYDIGMNEDAGDGDFNPLSVRIGFVLHF
ncbi:hypothetical protein MWU65_10115 [Cellulophaga sp. F20128]|uniref:hypothetical protein n=1 Tax=Cellulophaga sp. F20128 TaxID=2926413 RepID=UPI001FF10E53|nr:hypothetical protein [Cellulophaga sp. F20128]MCK0157534.1 hypothetical protein [Cellulophaga sp. F20128]